MTKNNININICGILKHNGEYCKNYNLKNKNVCFKHNSDNYQQKHQHQKQNKKTTNSNRDLYINIILCFAIFFIFLLHTLFIYIVDRFCTNKE